jgi:hypothetical protein
VIDGYDRLKNGCAMAIFADITCENVILILADRVGSVMAVDAVIRDRCVIKCCRSPAVCRMTVIANVTARNVCWMLTDCNRSVVTRGASACYLRMIHLVDRCEQHSIVAVLASIAGRNMIAIFACCICAVVTAEAITGDIDVIEVCRHPGRGRVAVVATVAAGDVCRVLTDRYCSVMTRRACADDLRMIDAVGRRENRYIVAVLADIARRYMVDILADRVSAIVTADAITSDIVVIKVCRQPGQGRMAIVAIIATRYVRRVLSFCD